MAFPFLMNVKGQNGPIPRDLQSLLWNGINY